MGTACRSGKVVSPAIATVWDLELALALAQEDLAVAKKYGGTLPFSETETTARLRRRVSSIKRKITILGRKTALEAKTDRGGKRRAA